MKSTQGLATARLSDLLRAYISAEESKQAASLGAEIAQAKYAVASDEAYTAMTRLRDELAASDTPTGVFVVGDSVISWIKPGQNCNPGQNLSIQPIHSIVRAQNELPVAVDERGPEK